MSKKEKAQSARPTSSDTLEFLPPEERIERGPPPFHGRLTLYALLITMLVFLIWAGFSEVDRVVTGKGKLSPIGAPIVLQPIETVVLREILVSPGDLVKAGQIVARFDPTISMADLRQLEERITTFDEKIKRLTAESNGTEYQTGSDGKTTTLQFSLFSARRKVYAAKIQGMKRRIEQIEAEIYSINGQMEALQAGLTAMQELEIMREKLVGKGYGTKANYYVTLAERMKLEKELVALRSKPDFLRREKVTRLAEIQTFKVEWRQEIFEKLDRLQSERSSLIDQRDKATWRTEKNELVTPADGVVVEVAELASGAVLRQAEQVVSIVPFNAGLRADILVSAKDIGDVYVGAPVRLKVDAFPFQRHGTLHGTVSVISESSFEDKRSTDVFYKVRVFLPGETNLHNMPNSSRLIAGMTIQAEIAIGKRTVLTYLTYPFWRTIDEALKEK